MTEPEIMEPEIIAGALTLIRDGRGLIADMRNWTQCSDARDCYNGPVWPHCESAIRWCLVGSVLHAGRVAAKPLAAVTVADRQVRLALATLDHCAAEIAGLCARSINDNGNPADAHRNALACADAAILRLERDLLAVARKRRAACPAPDSNRPTSRARIETAK